MNAERAKELLAEKVKEAGYVPLDRLERDGGWVPMEAALAAIQRAYALGDYENGR